MPDIEERERLVQLVTDALLHLPVRGKVLELAARQVILALEQDGAILRSSQDTK